MTLPKLTFAGQSTVNLALPRKSEPSVISNPFVSPDSVRFTGKPGKFRKHFPGRGFAKGSSATGLAATAALAAVVPPAGLITAVVTVPWAALNAWCLSQKQHTLLRNHGAIGLGRYIAEHFRPEGQQYLIEAPTEGKPFDLLTRQEVYRLAKGVSINEGFGTRRDLSVPGYETIRHSHAAINDLSKLQDMEVVIGDPNNPNAYKASRFNVSGMSYGALSKNAILALTRGAKRGGFYLNTGEGGISPYHLNIEEPIERRDGLFRRFKPNFYNLNFWEMIEQHREEVAQGADLVWNIGTGYFGCRDKNGNFDEKEFARKAKLSNVKMIELKLSQGAKPSSGGILPASKNTPEVAAGRGVQAGEEIHSPRSHSAFQNPIEMMQFIDRLKKLSDGKPVGFKLCIASVQELLAIGKAMLATGIYPDFITVDGNDGGTGSGPPAYLDHVGPYNADESIRLVHNMLIGLGVRDRVKIIAAGKVATGDNVFMKIALGADILNSARGMMLALGCLQTGDCAKDICPVGIATQQPSLVKGLDVEEKTQRVLNYQQGVIHTFKELLASSGIQSADNLLPEDILKRTERGPVPYDQLDLLEGRNLPVQPGAFLKPETVPEPWKKDWLSADPAAFLPLTRPASHKRRIPLTVVSEPTVNSP